ncbi:hypothetical protein PanWU01x14_309980 [Parasponia andersonii]|uniref:Uncharacterized protein n=1 Tax=Parasponia andersonii TaxID=3476 RepID=A0A2P5AQI9_PARAD|nr:hypothetical protein PanWU01x14_309980 [Parasponia andersonii]
MVAGYQEWAFRFASHGLAVGEHFVEQHRESSVVAMDDHGGRVPDEGDADSSHVQTHRRRVVVGGDDCNG